MDNKMTPRQVLAWYLEAGVDEAVGDAPVDRFAKAKPAVAVAEPFAPPAPKAPSPSMPATSAPLTATDEAVGEAHHAAAAATSVADLRRILEGFDGCALRKTATNLVLGDGNPEADIILIGEAPGAEEDRQGVPFVGPSGQLLDRMLASIGLDRGHVFISNTVFWRPPGNRSPTTGEMAVCMPFVERLIELVDPKILVAVGGPAASSLLAQNVSVSRLRGRWFPYSSPRLARPIEATAIYHPAFLLRSPAQKRAAWQDLLGIKRKLAAL